MKKKLSILALFLAIMIPLSGFNMQLSKQTSVNAKTEKTTELKMDYIAFGGAPKDLNQVTEEINKIAKAKINATIKIEAINVGAYSQQINLKLNSNEDMDMFVTGNIAGLFDYTGQASRGQLYALNDLLKKHGKGISAALGTEFLNASKVGGNIYGIPNIKDMAAGYGIYMRKDLADKYGIDVKKVKSLTDLEAVMKKMKQKEPNLYFGASGGSSLVDCLGVATTGDVLGDGYGVLMSTNLVKVVDYYETPQYASLLNTIRKWYVSGYILPDITTNKESTQSLIKANRIYGNVGTINPAAETTDSRGTGQQIVVNSFTPQISTTQSVTNFMWAIPNYSQKSEKAMEFLNLMYTDKDIFNLFAYGIEGKHYEKVSGTSNTIDFAKGVNASNSGYNLGQPFMFGNEFIGHVWNGSPADIWNQMDSFNKKAIKSRALGFLFDVARVKNEYAAVSNVVSQYKLALENGAVDPIKVLPEFISKLKAAGIDKIVAEKQRQLNKWITTNK